MQTIFQDFNEQNMFDTGGCLLPTFFALLVLDIYWCKTIQTYRLDHTRYKRSISDELSKLKNQSKDFITPPATATNFMSFKSTRATLDGKQALKLRCADTQTLAEKASRYGGIFIEIKHLNQRKFKPLVGINEKSRIEWNSEMGWDESVGGQKLAESKSTLAQRGVGGLTLTIPGNNCGKQSGKYKCTIFSYMKGKDKNVLHQTYIVHDVSGQLACDNPHATPPSPGPGTGVKKDPNNKDGAEVVPTEKKDTQKDDNMSAIIGATGVLLLFTAVGVLVWNKKRKAAQAKENEEAEKGRKKREAAMKKKAALKKKKAAEVKVNAEADAPKPGDPGNIDQGGEEEKT